MRPLLIIIGMTPSAVGLVSCIFPGSRLRIAGMAVEASYSGIVISRIAGRGVIEIYSQPVRGVVALITLHIGHKMSGSFSCCGGSVMTCRATSRHQTMIHGSRRPRQIVMATVTLT